MRRFLIFALAIVAGSAISQQTKKAITFEEAVKIALQNSVLLNQQKNNIEAVQAQNTSNWAGFAPTLGFQSQAVRVNGNTFNQQQGKVINGTFDQVTGSLNASLNLFSGLNQINKVKQSTSQVDAQAYNIKRTSQDVISLITAAYLQVLLDVELSRIAKENHIALSKQLEQITEQVKVGAKAPVDEYNQDSQTKAAEIRMLQSEINLTNDRALLTQILLQDPSDEYDVVKPAWLVEVNPNDFQKIFETALQNRADYQRALKNEEAAKYGMKATRGFMMPNLSAFGTVYSAYNHSHGDSTVRSFENQFTSDNIRKIYGLQLNIPILGGNQPLQNRANYIQQKVIYRNNSIIRSSVEYQVKTDVFRAYQNYSLFAKTFTVSEAQLKAAEYAYQLETERYNLGVSSFVDFINANKNYVQSQTDRAQAEYRMLFQKVLVDYAVGTIKPEDFEK